MFTGLIQNIGEVVRNEKVQDSPANSRRLSVRIPSWTRLFEVGESIAVNGVCLTVVEAMLDTFTAEVSPETLEKTNLDNLQPRSKVNLEFPICLSSPLGGHFVQGHIDTRWQVLDLRRVGDYHSVTIQYPSVHASSLIHKGSVSVDGVSLTINRLVEDSSSSKSAFEVMIIPHTWSATIFQNYQVGSQVNLEFDMLAKYIRRNFELLKEDKKYGTR